MITDTKSIRITSQSDYKALHKRYTRASALNIDFVNKTDTTIDVTDVLPRFLVNLETFTISNIKRVEAIPVATSNKKKKRMIGSVKIAAKDIAPTVLPFLSQRYVPTNSIDIAGACTVYVDQFLMFPFLTKLTLSDTTLHVKGDVKTPVLKYIQEFEMNNVQCTPDALQFLLNYCGRADHTKICQKDNAGKDNDTQGGLIHILSWRSVLNRSPGKT